MPLTIYVVGIIWHLIYKRNGKATFVSESTKTFSTYLSDYYRSDSMHTYSVLSSCEVSQPLFVLLTTLLLHYLTSQVFGLF